MQLHPDRFFDPDPGVREIARQYYQSVKQLPIVGPHGHVDPDLLAGNLAFPDPTELIILPDHYIYRMLYSQGIPLDRLGIVAADGSRAERDNKKIWRLFAEHFYLFAGTPTGAWLAHELGEVFGVERGLDAENAMEIYAHIAASLKMPEFLPRAMFERFNIEVLTTTDGAADSLAAHQAIRDSEWQGKVIPCFRPDAVANLQAPGWISELDRLSESYGSSIGSYADFIKAIESRREFFKQMGAVSTDQGVLSPFTQRLSKADASAIFDRALRGMLRSDDGAAFTAHMLMEMARMSIDDGLVMQIHPGSMRNHNQVIFDQYGPDSGCDIPVATDFTRGLHALLNAYGNDPRFRLIIFTLDESTYSRELAPLAGHYPAMRLGPPWWFHDSIEGITRFRQRVTETASIYNTAGFNDDTRAFPSIPARHDLSRRIDANFLAGMTARHIISEEQGMQMIRQLTYDLVKSAYRMDDEL